MVVAPVFDTFSQPLPSSTTIGTPAGRGDREVEPRGKEAEEDGLLRNVGVDVQFGTGLRRERVMRGRKSSSEVQAVPSATTWLAFAVPVTSREPDSPWMTILVSPGGGRDHAPFAVYLQSSSSNSPPASAGTVTRSGHHGNRCESHRESLHLHPVYGIARTGFQKRTARRLMRYSGCRMDSHLRLRLEDVPPSVLSGPRRRLAFRRRRTDRMHPPGNSTRPPRARCARSSCSCCSIVSAAGWRRSVTSPARSSASPDSRRRSCARPQARSAGSTRRSPTASAPSPPAVLIDSAGVRGLMELVGRARREGNSLMDVLRAALSDVAVPDWLPAGAEQWLHARREARREVCRSCSKRWRWKTLWAVGSRRFAVGRG